MLLGMLLQLRVLIGMLLWTSVILPSMQLWDLYSLRPDTYSLPLPFKGRTTYLIEGGAFRSLPENNLWQSENHQVVVSPGECINSWCCQPGHRYCLFVCVVLLLFFTLLKCSDSVVNAEAILWHCCYQCNNKIAHYNYDDNNNNALPPVFVHLLSSVSCWYCLCCGNALLSTLSHCCSASVVRVVEIWLCQYNRNVVMP